MSAAKQPKQANTERSKDFSRPGVNGRARRKDGKKEPRSPERRKRTRKPETQAEPERTEGHGAAAKRPGTVSKPRDDTGKPRGGERCLRVCCGILNFLKFCAAVPWCVAEPASADQGSG